MSAWESIVHHQDAIFTIIQAVLLVILARYVLSFVQVVIRSVLTWTSSVRSGVEHANSTRKRPKILNSDPDDPMATTTPTLATTSGMAYRIPTRVTNTSTEKSSSRRETEKRMTRSEAAKAVNLDTVSKAPPNADECIDNLEEYLAFLQQDRTSF